MHAVAGGGSARDGTSSHDTVQYALPGLKYPRTPEKHAKTTEDDEDMDPEALRRRLAERIVLHDSMLVAFSGGVDSTVLAVVAREVLGESMLAVVAESDTYPPSEVVSARALAKLLDLPLVEIHTNELHNEAFAANSPERCYYCKQELFSALDAIARDRGLAVVADGTNADDLDDHRPGRRAAGERGVVAPLAEVGLTKEQVRELARYLGLPNADKPSMACLASRFPYGDRIEAAGLERVGRAEDGVRALGLGQFRVRAHGPVARVEVAHDELERAWALRDRLADAVKAAGFTYVALDLEGYRTGALNEVLGAEALDATGADAAARESAAPDAETATET